VLLAIALINRLVMRILLRYHAWMSEKKPSIRTLAWGMLMKMYFGFESHPLTYSYQSAMPRLAVPPLESTITRYLDSVRHILSPKEYEEYESAARTFQRKEGPKLQRLLWCKYMVSTNYVSDWWEKYVYLRSRSPLLINSNYYGLGFADHIPSGVQTARAATLVYHYTHFKLQLDAEKLPPMTVRGIVPICMRQYERIFSTTRLPGRDSDTTVHLDAGDSVHIAVLYKGSFWRVNIIDDHTHAPVSAYELQEQFDTIIRLAEDKSSRLKAPAPNSPEACLPALTALNRTRWAEIREDHFKEGLNKISLDEIENAVFVVHLDDRAPKTWTETGNLSLHGEGTTRWLDKSFNLIVFANGQASVHAEHSWADAPVIAHAWEWVLCHEHYGKGYDAKGNVKVPEAEALERQPSTPRQKPQPWRLEFDFSDDLKSGIRGAVEHAKGLCNDLHLIVDCYSTQKGGYGKGFIKKQKMSPDAWIQMCLQLAWKRDQGKTCLTYEAAAVRLFNEGRTETIRSNSAHMFDFINIMEDAKASKQDKIAALRKAASTHVAVSRDASVGKGVDRHLFCLYVCSLGLNMDIKFLKDALSMPWQLSTSQIPQRQTENIWPKHADSDLLVSPSGGFGPVADDGYGVSYMMANDDITFFHISSKRSCKKTDSEKFKAALWKAHEDMRALFDE